MFLTHSPSYLSISHVQSQVTLVTAWNCADAVSLEPAWCLCLTGNLVWEGGNSLTILAPKQWVALMLLLLCSHKRWLAVWLSVSFQYQLKTLQLEAQQIFRLTLPRWVISLWCVCTTDGRERSQGYSLAVVQDCFPLPCLSASDGGIFSSRASALPASWNSYTEERFVFPSPPAKCKTFKSSLTSMKLIQELLH